MKKTVVIVAALAILASALVSVLAVGDFPSPEDEEQPKNYVWILEAYGDAETALAAGRAKGTRVKYTFSMRYVSLSGDLPDEGEIPTRFIGGAVLDAEYDYSGIPKIKSLIAQSGKDSVFTSGASLLTQAELDDFETDFDGTYSTAIDFHAADTVLFDSEAVLAALGGENHSGTAPGRTVTHGYGKENATVLINVEADAMELGSGSDYGVRTAMVLVTVYGSEDEKDEFSFEIKGVLKRVVCTPENVYSILLAPSAKKIPQVKYTKNDEFEALDCYSSVSRIKAYLSGGVFWPDVLPSSIPDFDEAEKLTEVKNENGVVYVTAVCTWAQFDAYKKRLVSEGFTSRGGDVFSPACYIRTSSKTLDRDLAEMTLEIHLPPKNTRIEGFEIFPDFTYGCILKAPHGEGVPKTDNEAWMSVYAYGAQESSFVSYGKELETLGFSYDLDEYVRVSDGYRYTFSAEPFEDDFAKGMLLTFYVIKE